MFIVQTSDWSNIHTINLADGSISTFQNPIIIHEPPTTVVATPMVTQTLTSAPTERRLLGDGIASPLTALTVIVGAIAVLCVAVVSLLVYVRKIKNRLPKQ